jgi:hypothetical protein
MHRIIPSGPISSPDRQPKPMYCPSVKVNSVPQPEHQRRRSLSLDSASTGISSLLQGTSGKRSLCSTVDISHRNILGSTILQERTTGEGNSSQDRSGDTATQKPYQRFVAVRGLSFFCSPFETNDDAEFIAARSVIEFGPLSPHLSEHSIHPEQGTLVMAKKAPPTRAKPPAVAHHDPNLKFDIETLFDTICAQQPMIHLCENCGSEMVNINVVLVLANSERSWSIPLPICKKCNREKHLKFISRQSA